MKRREIVKIMGLSAFAVSMSGFELVHRNGRTITDCATSTDMLGPYYRQNAPARNDFSYVESETNMPLTVRGKLYGADCNQALSGVTIDIWHCDHNGEYDMQSKEFKCRGRLVSDLDGNYWFKTSIPPPYEGRPKHIHYLVHETKSHQRLVTQLYFQGDENLEQYNWMMYPRDDRRILEVYKNTEGMAEVNLDLFLTSK